MVSQRARQVPRPHALAIATASRFLFDPLQIEDRFMADASAHTMATSNPFVSVSAFLRIWEHEALETSKLLEKLTDASLDRPISPDVRSIGRLAWHLAMSMGEIARAAGLAVDGKDEKEMPVPPTAAAIKLVYDRLSAAVLVAVRDNWTDDSLTQMQEMFGEQWSRGFALWVLVGHQTHHRGQLTVLMRQAGLAVHGLFGPSRDEWAQWGMTAPA
jgi:uncharacterized damage-inducible protein DinB